MLKGWISEALKNSGFSQITKSFTVQRANLNNDSVCHDHDHTCSNHYILFYRSEPCLSTTCPGSTCCHNLSSTYILRGFGSNNDHQDTC